MEDYAQIASDLIKDFRSSTYFVFGGNAEGLSVMAYEDSEKINFGYNLGGNYVPTKDEATELLQKLTRHYQTLCEVSAEWVDYVHGRAFEAELLVMSGHMDFSVAKMVGEEIVWFSELK